MRLVRHGFIAAAAVAIAVAGQAVAADAALEKAITARKGQMQLYSLHLGALGAMAKGQQPYDAKVAQSAANNLVTLSKLEGSLMWPQGSDSTAMPAATRAKAEAWTTYPEVAEKGKALTEAATALAAVAGDGLAALQSKVGDVGKTCGGCHKPFRAPKS